MRRERGASLIFVLGILALLSLFAISFATVTRVERTASANYVDEVRAKLAARAGLAAGIAAAHEGFRTPSPGDPGIGGYLDGAHAITVQAGSSLTLGSVTGISVNDTLTLYGGANGLTEDVKVNSVTPATNTVTVSPSPSAGRLFAVPRGANWYFVGHSRNPVSTGNGIPLALAMTTQTGTSLGSGVPSLHVATGPSLATSVRLVSGSTGGTYFADPALGPYVVGGDIYGTKILDSAGMLDANMDGGELTTILKQFGDDVVAEAQAISDSISPAFSPATTINNYIPLKDASNNAYGNPFASGSNVATFLAYRDKLSGKRFRSKQQLKGAFYAMAGGDAVKGDAWFAVFRDYFTCFGDGDSTAVLDDDPSSPSWNPPGGVVLSGGVPDVSQIVQNKLRSSKATSVRMPVNINTAPVPVLRAVVRSVKALSNAKPVQDPNATALQPISINAGLVPMAPYGAAGNGTVLTVLATEIDPIVDALVNARPFRSWNEVYRALAKLHGKGVNDQALAAVMAATCPVDLGLTLNADRSLRYWDAIDPEDPNAVGFPIDVEKAGTHSCADFSFTSGYFEVESIGRIYANPTAPFVVAEATKRCVVNVGGVFWVRGERDLAASLPADLMGAPLVNADLSYGGGWVQPKPSDTGLHTPGTIVGNTWTPNVADGFLMQRTQWAPTNGDVFIAHSNTSPAPDDRGQVEMWVKAPFDVKAGDPTSGTNEALFMNIRNYNTGLRHSEPGFETEPDPKTVTQIGVATRLERYGDKLYFCRFFWGYPDGASPAKVGEDTEGGGAATNSNPTTKYINNMHGFITSPSLTWMAGTWHHVYISWDVMNMKMFVDGEDMGSSSLPSDYKGGVVWENTVQGFFPQGSGGMDPNNQFKDIPRDGSGDAQVQAAEDAAQAHFNQDTSAQNAMPVESRTPANPQWQTLEDHKQQVDKKTIDDAEKWKQGGGSGQFATDVSGMTFTAQLGLRRMMLRTHLPIPGASNAQADQGVTESYFLGFKTPDPYGGETPPQIVTLDFAFAEPSFYRRYCNGTYDGIHWTQAASLSAPTPMRHRYNTDAESFDVTVKLPTGWKPVAFGHHVIIAHDVYPNADPDLFGGGRTDTSAGPAPLPYMTVTGQTVKITKRFPQGSSTCNVKLHHSIGCTIPGSNETPWAVGGVWLAYEKPTVFLEAPEVDE